MNISIARNDTLSWLSFGQTEAVIGIDVLNQWVGAGGFCRIIYDYHAERS